MLRDKLIGIAFWLLFPVAFLVAAKNTVAAALALLIASAFMPLQVYDFCMLVFKAGKYLWRKIRRRRPVAGFSNQLTKGK